MRKPCSHGLLLPKGLLCNRGYLFVRIFPDKKAVLKGCGLHTKENQKTAILLLNDYRQKIALNAFELPQKLERLSLREAWAMFYKHHYEEWKHPSRNVYRTENSKASAIGGYTTIAALLGNPFFDAISAEDVRVKLKDQLLAQGKSPATVNKYKGLLSSMFTVLKRLSVDGRIEPVRLPKENPCQYVPDLEEKRLSRILTKYEAQKLKYAFQQLQDMDGWEICKLALKGCLSEKDLRKLEIGQTLDLERAKTGVAINIPITVLVTLNWKNWRNRFKKARDVAGLFNAIRPLNVTMRVLRKTGINWLEGRHEEKLVSQYAGHASIKTTERHYSVTQSEKLRPLADDLSKQVDDL
jgi:hypothetical protein